MEYGTVCQFKPYVAKYIYWHFNATHVLDPCAGWGDRCVAAMATGIDYTGVDTNLTLCKPYHKMIGHFQERSKSKVNMLFQQSEGVDFGTIAPYDLIFTSPPYKKVERYVHMPEYDDFVEEFLLPVTQNAWKHLQPSGVMALNMPAVLYESIRPIFREAQCIPMPIANRFSWKSAKKQHEIIYCWQK